MKRTYPRRVQANKFNAKRTIVEGVAFPSMLEAKVYEALKLMETNKILTDLKLQPSAKLTKAEITWKIDFCYKDLHSGEIVFVEAKGMETDRYRLTKRLWPYYGYGRLEVWKGRAGSVRPVEVIDLIPERKLWLEMHGSPFEGKK